MKIIRYIIPIAFIVVSIMIMESGSHLKLLWNGREIPVMLDEINYDIQKENWINAENKVSDIRKTFDNVTKLIQFSVERDELIGFKHHLSLLNGYLVSQDSSNATAEIHLLNEYWEELGK